MKALQLPSAPPPRPVGKKARSWRDYEWSLMGPFIAVHLAPLGGLVTGASARDWICLAVLYLVQMFGVTAGYHRYFSHRAFKTSRLGQFLLAFLAQTVPQRGVLWWAAHHRHHHRHSDEERDIHSPKRWGFWYAHISWIYDDTRKTNYGAVKDFARYPELVLLNKVWYLPSIVMGTVIYLLLGWSGLFVGYFLSAVLVCHATFFINSLAHVMGTVRFPTGDTSRNHWFPAILTLGEGWHNNHHYYQSSARMGFYWWEIDLTFYVLWLLSKLGLVWDLRQVPDYVYAAANGDHVAD